MRTIPTTHPYATSVSALKAEPDSAARVLGLIEGERPPAEYFNYYWDLASQVALTFTDTDDATNSTNGAVAVAGGLSVVKTIYAGSTTESTTKDTGSIITDGGIGAEKSIVAGIDITATRKIIALDSFTSRSTYATNTKSLYNTRHFINFQSSPVDLDTNASIILTLGSFATNALAFNVWDSIMSISGTVQDTSNNKYIVGGKTSDSSNQLTGFGKVYVDGGGSTWNVKVEFWRVTGSFATAFINVIVDFTTV
jgi:hypothetical protein